MNDFIDEKDYKTLLTAILRQSIDDYIKLAHPYARRKHYLQELYLTAVAFLFDEDYRMSVLNNSYNKEMSTEDLLADILDSDRTTIHELRKYAIQQAKEYWETKQLAVIDHIPDTIFIAGHTFDIHHDEQVNGFEVSEDEKIIRLNKRNNHANQANFFRAIMYTTALVSDQPIKLNALKELSDEMFTVLKANNIFSYVGSGSAHTTPQTVE